MSTESRLDFLDNLRTFLVFLVVGYYRQSSAGSAVVLARDEVSAGGR